MSTESNMDNFAIRTLQNYGVKITIDRNLPKSRMYIFTPSTIAGSPEDRAQFQLAIDLMVDALDHHCEYIHYFD